MKNYTIKVTEHREGLFVVEAEDENDALERLGRTIETDFFGMTSITGASIPSAPRSNWMPRATIR